MINKGQQRILLFAAAFCASSFLLLATSQNTFADSIEPSISISPSGTLDIAASSGGFAYGQKQLTISTTNYTGYTLTISTADGQSALVNNADSTKTIPTITLPSGRESIISSEFSVTSYGISIDGTNYKPFISETELKNTNSGGSDTVNLTFGVKVNSDTISGVYSKTFLLSTVANYASYVITYNANTEDTVTGMPIPNPQQGSTDESTITLADAIPERVGYSFLGWNTDSTATTATYEPSAIYTIDKTASNSLTLYAIWERKVYNVIYNINGGATGNMTGLNKQNVDFGSEIQLSASNYSRSSYGFAGWNTLADGTGENYGPNETVTVNSTFVQNADASNNVTLYANWKASAGTLQGWTGCSNLEPGEVTALTDNRETQQVYAVAKLADGNCWMIENLRIGRYRTGSYSTVNTMTELNSQGVGGVFTALASSESANFSESTTSNTYYNTTNITGLNQAYRFPRNNGNNVTSRASNPTSDNSNLYSYGSYYTFAAAIANTDDITTDGTIVSTSICPAGWHIPYGYTGTNINSDNTSGGFGYLKSSLATGETLTSYPNNFVFGGEYNGSSASIRGSFGNYWTSTVSSYNLSYNEIIGTLPNNYQRPFNYSQSKYIGSSVRCVAGEPQTFTLTYVDTTGDNSIVVPESQTVIGNGIATFSIPNTTPSRPEYAFRGWNTQPDGSGTMYSKGASFITSTTSSTLYAIWHCQTFSICYRKNGDNVEGTMGVVSTSGSTLALMASNYSRSGYGFAGWNTKADGSGTAYGPNQYITRPDNYSSTGIELFAQWVSSAGSLQNWSGCTSLSVGDVTALTDTRDNQTYAIAKLIDGYCWMIENLRVGNLDSNGNQLVMNSANSEGVGGVFVGLAASENGSGTTANSLYSTENITGSQQALRFPRYNNINTYNRTTYLYTGQRNSNIYSYGNYYTWAAANADTSLYYTDSDVSDITPPTLSGTSICPTGWRLPSGGTESEKQAIELLTNVYEFPNNFVRAGTFTFGTGVSSNRGSYAYYWTRSYFEYNSAPIVGEGFTNSVSRENAGLPVRCLTGPSLITHTLNYDANGGTNAPVSQTRVTSDGASFTVSRVIPTRPGYAFIGWAETPDAGVDDRRYGYVVNLGTSTLATTEENKTLYAVWTDAYNFVYDINGGDTGNMSGLTHDNIGLYYMPEYFYTTLYEPNYSRAGYGFAGWNLQPDGSGTSFGPNQVVSPTEEMAELADNNKNIKLYANWIPSGGNMQGWTGCAQMEINEITALTDTRDGQVYAIAKLADDNCWMIENLRLGHTKEDGITDLKLDSLNSQGVGGVFTGLAEPEYDDDGNFVGSLRQNSLYSIENIVGDNQHTRFPRYQNFNTANRSTNPTERDDNLYGKGNLYTWAAAVANTDNYAIDDETPETSICPAGWHLPYGGTSAGTSGGISYLSIQSANYQNQSEYHNNNLVNYPKNFLFDDYWTSTSAGDWDAYYYYIRNSGRYYAEERSLYQNYKSLTRSIRCVSNSQYNTYYLQFSGNAGTDIVTNLPSDQEITGNEIAVLEIPNGIPTRNGYTFIEYNTSADGSGNSIKPNSTYITRDTTTTLYAIWNINEMQNWNGCSSLPTNGTIILYDNRDDNSYRVRKLADNNCWMTENLRLEKTSNLVTLDHTNTDLPINTTFTLPDSQLTGTSTWSNIEESHVYSNGSDTLNDGDNLEQYTGNYYNWYTATGGTGNASTSSGEATGSLCPAGWRLPSSNNLNNLTSAYASNYLTAPTSLLLSGLYNSGAQQQNNEGHIWTSTATTNSTATSLLINNNNITSSDGQKTSGYSIRCVVKEPSAYLLTYNANAGIDIVGDVPTSQTEYANGVATFTITIKTPSRPGYTFVKWNTSPDGTGEDYDAGSTISTTEASTTLYAIWNARMQNWTGCSALATNSSTYLVDERDNNTYRVTKFTDGNCWMTENLRLERVGDFKVLSSDDSDLLPETTFILPYSQTSLDYDGYQNDWSYTPNTPHLYSNGQSTVADNDNQIQIIGNYYDWYTATAGTGNIEVNQENISSICPSGWKLPSVDHYNYLDYLKNYLGQNITIAPFSFIVAGYYPEIDNDYNYSYYWAASVSEENESPYAFEITDNGTYVYELSSPYMGAFVRCVVRDTETFTLNFEENAGYDLDLVTNMPSSQTTVANRLGLFVIPGTTPNRPGYTFIGWSEHENGAGPYHNAGDSFITSAHSTTLYAAWQFSLEYNANSGADAVTNLPSTQITGGNTTANFTITDIIPLRTNLTFVSWNTHADGTGNSYTAGDIFTASSAASNLYAMWNYTINYNSNSGVDTASNMPAPQTALGGSSVTFTVSDIVPNRVGYAFANWNTAADGSGTTYYEGEQVTTSDKSFTLYAIWVEQTTMQNWNGCSLLAQGDTSSLRDTRDNNVYQVRKMPDGNCWMVENLRLEKTSTLTTLNSTNTDINNGTTFTLPETSEDTWEYWDEQTPYIYSNGNDTLEDGDGNTQLIGNYYSWNAATVGNTDPQSQEVPNSICPAGWKLPSITQIEELIPGGYYYSDEPYFTKFPYSIIPSGQYGYSEDYGKFWTSSGAEYSMTAYVLIANAYEAYTTDYDIVGYGFSIRCVARNSSNTFTILFDANAGQDEVTNLPNSQTSTGHSSATSRLSGKTPQRIGFEFQNWNTSFDGTGTSYNPGQTITVNTSSTTLYAIWSASTLTLSYDANAGSDTVTNLPPSQTITGASSFTLSNTVPNRNGYIFIGWATSADETNTFYNPSDTFAVSQTNTTLYAIWGQSIQDWSGCSGLQIGEAVILTDSRDKELYTIGKLADNNCWFLDNLRLDLTNLSVINNLTSSTTNATDTIITYLKTGGGSASNNYATSGVTSWGATNSYTTPLVITSDKNSTVTGYGRGSNKIGVYYNFCAATAGSYCYENNGATANVNAVYDICPAGWRLPTGSEIGEYKALMDNYDNFNAESVHSFQSKSSLLLSGHVGNSGSLTGQNSSGNFWSSTRYDNNNVYSLFIDAENVNPISSLNRSYGSSVRCVLKHPSSFTLNYDGNAGNDTVSNLPASQTITGDSIAVFTLPNTVPTRSGYTFDRWNSAPDGSGQDVSPSDYYQTNQATSTIYAIWKCPSNKICYSKNGTDAVGAMGDQNAYNGTAVYLLAPNYYRTGYGFTGWNTASNGSGTMYGPNETVTFNSVSPFGIQLYAIWTPSVGTFQDWNSCSSLNKGDVTALTDSRDGQTYAIARLDDGLCWTIENFRVGHYAGDGVTQLVMNSSNSQGVYGNFVGLAQPETSNFAYTMTSNSIYDSTTVESNYSFPRYNNSNTTNLETAITHPNSNIYGYGNYYTWAAATATTEEYRDNSSICPKGWHLPLSTSDNNQFLNLNYFVNNAITNDSSKLRKYPNNFLLSGYIDGSTIQSRNSYGYYWAATGDNNTNSGRTLYFSSSTVSTRQTRLKYYGNPIRCASNNTQSTKLTFDANGGTWSSYTRSVTIDTPEGQNPIFTIPNTLIIKRDGYAFYGWAVSPNATEAEYVSSDLYEAPYSPTLNYVLYAVWKEAYTINFDINGGDEGVMTNLKVKDLGVGKTGTLIAPNYSRAGYGFAGWNTKADGTGTTYGPNQSITMDNSFISLADNSRNITLYAKWVLSAGNLQEWNGCSNLSTNGVTALTDSRDGQTYAVAKLADGNCWMIENLRVGHYTSDGVSTLTMDASNTQGVGTGFIGLAEPETSNFGSTNANSIYDTTIITGSNQSYRFPRYNDQNTNHRSSNPESASSTSSFLYGYGNYYTWAAAIADYSGYSTETIINTSICPKGWQLPYGGNANSTYGGNTKGGFYYLGVQLQATANNQNSARIWRQYPNNFIMAGYTSSGSTTYSKASYGYYWTTSSYSEYSARDFNIGISELRFSYDGKRSGYSVRCLIQN